ncbi:MAG: DHCW motif cupin fold protein [Bacteroidota bacterium]
MSAILFQTIDWNSVEAVEHPGLTGKAWWRTMQYAGLRIRQVEYSPGYTADHWCQKGHIVHCIAGSLVSELETGEAHLLSEGMTYVVTDEASSHRSVSEHGARLLIVDGEFLKGGG